ncbi:right-handed parallel beta-helix repeat-containing protein [Streptomyces sp. NPDC048696]|uniref:right-handed parallel beta-helix repeat-containing protein n=1 Tax=Streptomyces sp. NPDC048696 TaxID=3365585 RepID=UPI00371158D3
MKGAWRSTARPRGGHRRRRSVLACLSVLVALGAMVGIAPAARAAATLVVPRDYPTIQAAVNAAASGDTVVVRGGTYTEQVVVSGKNLRLRGVDEDSVIIKSPTALTPYAVNAHNNQPVTSIVRIAHGARVRMSGFTVTGPVPCGPLVSGVVALQAATLDLTDSRITDMRPAPSCPADQADGRGVAFGLPPFIRADGVAGSTAFGSVSDVRVVRYQSDGINVNGPPSPPQGKPTRVTVTDNVVVGGTQIPGQQFGVSVGSAVATVTDNTISRSVCTIPGCGPDPINDIQSGGILAAFTPPGSTFSGNHVSHTDIGIYQFAGPNCCRVTRNELRNNRFFGIVIQDGDGLAGHNEITGGRVGIGVVADAVDTKAILRDNRITRTTMAPVRELQCCGFKATAVVERD